MKQECVTMLLAGGVGKRLGLLTQNIAKPAVPFGGKYRIIDFTLSNCMQSNMNTVGVVTQYNPFELHKHIGAGDTWDLNKNNGGLTILSPFTEQNGGDWYRGTADAVTKNISFIDQYDPEYVMILSGDHIYHMDYDKLLHHHKQKDADVTISTIKVPWSETSRFGILHTDEHFKIYDFEEKPVQAKNNLASMGIYIFNWNILKQYLEMDASAVSSDHDFGKDIIPALIEDQVDVYAYQFQGYWKDVGTIESYWEAHMDLLQENFPFSLHQNEWNTYSHNSLYGPQLVDENGIVRQSLIHDGCMFSGEIDRSVLFENVHVGKGSVIKQSVVHPGARIGSDVVLDRVIIQEDVIIPNNVNIVAALDEEPIVLSKNNIESKLLVKTS
ncbi:glucose-1-phosphate adenylyltransferase [Gracilibacillus sp. YIM 98692]|uniref:glucose-1-phosphate adenylyltransferase n=1 Tax=Gracilibacillus sp. YIM 98692 TaxID=2663532 RepID=UPI0013D5134E|nr:glucose-1-phosphate adenylyltransferase [Gracilibacillus sp. YIM 98692]